MFLAALLIGLREGLEASLIVGILLAYVTKQGRHEQRGRIAAGVILALALSIALGALFTYSSQKLSFTAQEIVGGGMSLLAVAMITWMVFWMLTMGRRMKSQLEGKAGDALATGAGWAMFTVAFVAVAREGIETTLILWGWALEPTALGGALVGILIATVLGYLIYRGALRINFATFFAWTGAFLVVVAAGILAYGIHDLQEAGVLPGPFSGHPITPTDLRTGDVLTGFTDGPFWMASFPFGWAFDVGGTIDPSSWAAAFLKGIVGFTPQMSWLQVLGWLLYVGLVLPPFLRRARANIAGARAAQARIAAAKAAPTSQAPTPQTPTPQAPTPQAPAPLAPATATRDAAIPLAHTQPERTAP